MINFYFINLNAKLTSQNYTLYFARLEVRMNLQYNSVFRMIGLNSCRKNQEMNFATDGRHTVGRISEI